jgi:hypothetical protein
MDNNLKKLDIFVERMDKLGIKLELSGNIPWIYINKINGVRVKSEDYFCGNHGFTVAFYPVRNDKELEFTDIGEIFKLIRKYTNR